MGVITLTLITAGALAPDSAPPFWVVLSAGLAIALGTYMGGWRIIRTLGKRVSDIHTPQGFAAETSATAVHHRSTTVAAFRRRRVRGIHPWQASSKSASVWWLTPPPRAGRISSMT
jgi:hypothetical protein